MIREMLPSDWDRVREIYLQGIETGKSTFTTECPSYEEWDAAHLKDCRFVDVEDGVVAGWVVLSPTSTREMYKGVVELSLNMDSAYHGRGIGTALMNHISEASEEVGYWTIYTCVLRDNTASLAMNRKCGYREIGYREKIAKDKFGNWQDVIIFERRSKKVF